MLFAIGWGIPLVLSERFINSVIESLVVVIIESLNLKASTDKGGKRFSCLVWLHLEAHEQGSIDWFCQSEICA